MDLEFASSLKILCHTAGIFWSWIPLLFAHSTVWVSRRVSWAVVWWCETPENIIVTSFFGWQLKKVHPVLLASLLEVMVC